MAPVVSERSHILPNKLNVLLYEGFPLVIAPRLIHRSQDARDDKKARIEVRERKTKLGSRYQRKMTRKIGSGRVVKLCESWYRACFFCATPNSQLLRYERLREILYIKKALLKM